MQACYRSAKEYCDVGKDQAVNRDHARRMRANVWPYKDPSERAPKGWKAKDELDGKYSKNDS